MKRVFAYYISGFLATLIIHILIGWENRVLVPRSFLVLIVLGLIGLPWAFLNMSNLLCPRKRLKNLRELLIHGFFLVLISVVLLTTPG